MPSVNPGPAQATANNLTDIIGNPIFIETITVSLTPLAVATITTAEQSFGAAGVSQVTAATGILAGDIILAISAPSLVAGVGIAGFRVDATVNDKFYITFVNPTAGSVTPVSGSYKITVARLEQSTNALTAVVTP